MPYTKDHIVNEVGKALFLSITRAPSRNRRASKAVTSLAKTRSHNTNNQVVPSGREYFLKFRLGVGRVGIANPASFQVGSFGVGR